MTTSMRERIARAIVADDFNGDSTVYDDMGANMQANFLANADAVLDAMLEPTEEMCVAGLETNTRFGPRAMGAIFRAMIRAAKEGK